MAIRILIVDDDQGFLGVAAELLAARGFEVIGRVGDAAQALAATSADCLDGILLDVNLPGRDGFATAVALADACPSARIVLTSAEAGPVAAEVLQDCRADAFVPKQRARDQRPGSAVQSVGSLNGDGGPEHGPLRGRAGNGQRPAERADPVAQPGEAAGLRPRGLAGNPEGGARELESYLRVLRFMGRLAGGPEPSIAMR